MLTFPLPAPLKNNIVFMRSGESFSDAKNEIQTNPAKKLRQDNALTFKGREQIDNAVKLLTDINFIPSYIWVSNTERAYESATLLAREFQIGQNRIVPEFTFLDARAAGIYEGKSIDSWDEIHKHDEIDGIKYRPPVNTDGTPSDSVSDVLVRDSEILSILQAALYDENPDQSLPFHARFHYSNGELRVIKPVVKPRELLVTGQTQSEADSMTRKVTAMRYLGDSKKLLKENKDITSWVDIWKLSIDYQ
eukprot:gene18499-24216_t